MNTNYLNCKNSKICRYSYDSCCVVWNPAILFYTAYSFLQLINALLWKSSDIIYELPLSVRRKVDILFCDFNSTVCWCDTTIGDITNIIVSGSCRKDSRMLPHSNLHLATVHIWNFEMDCPRKVGGQSKKAWKEKSTSKRFVADAMFWQLMLLTLFF